MYELMMPAAKVIRKSAAYTKAYLLETLGDILSGGGPKGTGDETERAAVVAALSDLEDAAAVMRGVFEDSL